MSNLEERTDRRPVAGRETIFRTLMEASIDGILVVSNDREYVTYNQQFVDMWGVPEELVENEPEAAALEWVRETLEHPEEFIEKVEYLYAHPEEESRDQIPLADGRVFDRYSSPVVADDGTHFGRVWFFRNVTDRVEAVRELERRNDRLTEFASVLAHDLRNPLNVAAGHLDLARADVDSDDLRAVGRAHDRINALVDDMLTLAKQGKQIEDVQPVELRRIVESAWGNVETVDTELVLATELMVVADPSRLEQLFENLLRNAIEHGGADVTVLVGDLENGFYVEDDAGGIPPRERDRVFEAGYSSSTDGTGFGLSIVKGIVEAHGWTIQVTGGADGGARFEIDGVEIA